MQKVLIIAALFTALITNINSQSKFQLQFHGGYSHPTSDMEGVFPDTLGTDNKLDFTTARTLLTKKGFHFGTAFKFAVDTVGNAKLTGGLNYSSFSGSKEYPIPFKPTRIYKSTVTIFTISAGAEYSFTPDKRVNPFAGVELAANFFGGNIKADGDTSFVIDRSQETRLGITAGAGLNININKKISVVIGVKYSFANLIGKSSESTETTTTGNNTDIGETGTVAVFELPLNDGALGRNDSKTFTYFQFYGGISFSLGKMLGK